jgi:hypothetical protein
MVDEQSTCENEFTLIVVMTDHILQTSHSIWIKLKVCHWPGCLAADSHIACRAHAVPLPCRTVNSHMPCRTPALLRQRHVLRESPHGSWKYPNC